MGHIDLKGAEAMVAGRVILIHSQDDGFVLALDRKGRGRALPKATIPIDEGE